MCIVAVVGIDFIVAVAVFVAFIVTVHEFAQNGLAMLAVAGNVHHIHRHFRLQVVIRVGAVDGQCRLKPEAVGNGLAFRLQRRYMAM